MGYNFIKILVELYFNNYEIGETKTRFINRVGAKVLLI